MSDIKKSYSAVCTFLKCFFAFLYKIEVFGRENIPDGPSVICANHSSWLDPLMLFHACGKEHIIHIMAKVVIFKVPVLKSILWKIGAIPVNRNSFDINAIKSALKALKANECVGIFPEGTRRSRDFEVDAKAGAVRIAEKGHAPVVPVCIPRKKKLFGTVKIYIGQPYYINPNKEKLTSQQYLDIANELMHTITSLERRG